MFSLKSIFSASSLSKPGLLKKGDLLLLVVLFGSTSTFSTGISECPLSPDDDGDGYTIAQGDCDDSDNAVYPGAAETCDGKDNNCDGHADEGLWIKQVAAGTYHSLALCSDGTVWAWGDNASGQLGDGTMGSSDIPVHVVELESVIKVEAGNNFSLALTGNGDVWAWGDDSSGQLGDGNGVSSSSKPVQVLISGVSDIAAGGAHALAIINADHSVYAWGRNTMGQLGNGTTDDHFSPVKAAISNATAIAAGDVHSLAISGGTTVFAWGSNDYGQLGNTACGKITDIWGKSSPTPYPVNGLPACSGIAGGEYFSLALCNGGSAVYAFGDNSSGQLGNNGAGYSCTPVSTQFPNSVKLSKLSAGSQHSLALADDTSGTVWAWGENNDGQLGDGTTNTRLSPVRTSMNEAIDIAAGGYFSLGLDSSYSVYAWGNNEYGQLGNGTTTSPSTSNPIPIKITTLP